MIYIILAIVWAVTWGCITKKVNENKGYYGGFWLGFWLGFIGLIIVSCKEDNRPAYNSTSDYIAPLEKSEDIWKCAKCGRYNSGYACECGILRGDSAWLFIPLIWITEFCRFAGRRLPWWILVGGTLGIAGVTYWISLAVFPYPADRLLWAIGSYRFPLVFPQMQVIAWLAVILVPLLVARLPEKMTWRYYSGAWVLQFILMLFVLNLYGKYGIGLNKEEVMGYDYHVRMQEWDEVIAMAEKKAPDTPMSVSCLNLALAMKGQLPERMFSFYQRGKEGLLMSFVNDFTIPLVAGEPYYYLGLVNVAQQFVFEAMEAVPDYRKSVRCFKRLAETNLINGRYEVARKYLRILQHTLFYKDWATETLACLNDEDRVNAHPEYGRLRRLTPRTDFFFNPDLPEMTLEFLLHANPRNRMAYEYLMACTLLKKDVGRFVHYYPLGADL